MAKKLTPDAKTAPTSATDPENGNSAVKKAGATERREYIKQSIADGKELTFDDLIKVCGHVSDQQLYKDAAALRQARCAVTIKVRTFKHDPSALTTGVRRTRENAAEKEAIAKISTQLVMPTEDEIEQFAKKRAFDGELKLRLDDYWKKENRLLILDAGSTTAEIAQHIAKLHTPDGTRRLSSLRVLTNGELVHWALNDTDCTHRLIFLGGAERFDTGAIAGTLAERCLDAWGLQADIAIIGTTNLNDNMKFCCDHEDEAYIKNKLLTSARIRCIAGASQKFVGRASGSAFPFVDLSQHLIDIIITDSSINNARTGEQEVRRTAFLKAIKDRKIALVTD